MSENRNRIRLYDINSFNWNVLNSLHFIRLLFDHLNPFNSIRFWLDPFCMAYRICLWLNIFCIGHWNRIWLHPFEALNLIRIRLNPLSSCDRISRVLNPFCRSNWIRFRLDPFNIFLGDWVLRNVLNKPFFNRRLRNEFSVMRRYSERLLRNILNISIFNRRRLIHFHMLNSIGWRQISLDGFVRFIIYLFPIFNILWRVRCLSNSKYANYCEESR